ncbi:hypothetical protein BDY24DRAFT_287527 [Mrakia frigida]|uniref:uncharacterized protein n=1 Tax=Mrakia frigida TaxID=29902 RepID=UPI003FCC1F0B
MNASGSWKWSMWVPAFFCALSLAVVLVYAIFERSIPEENKVMTGKKLAARRAARGVVDKKTTLATRYTYVRNSIFAIPAAFWLLILSQLLQSSAVSAYSANLADIIAVTRDATKETAGYTASLAQVMPIVLTPVLGYTFDLIGRRMFLGSLSFSFSSLFERSN